VIGDLTAQKLLCDREEPEGILEKGIACACFGLLYVRKHLVFCFVTAEYIICETISASRKSMRMTANHETFYRSIVDERDIQDILHSKEHRELCNGQIGSAISRSQNLQDDGQILMYQHIHSFTTIEHDRSKIEMTTWYLRGYRKVFLTTLFSPPTSGSYALLAAHYHTVPICAKLAAKILTVYSIGQGP
jgi:hypothetical protein